MNALIEHALEVVAAWVATWGLLIPAWGPSEAPPPPPAISETPVTFSVEAESRVVDAADLYVVALEVSGDPGWASKAVEIADCESNRRLHIYGDGGRAFGLFQVHGRFHGAVPKTVRGQVAQAYAIWSADEGRWRLWSCA